MNTDTQVVHVIESVARDRGCVFLSPDNRCRLHERYGAEAKPLACRLYPFVLVPAGDHWRVSLRFACPSVATNQGRALPQHADEILRRSRPTAVNLSWALDLIRREPTYEQARQLHAEEVERCRRMAAHAAGLLATGTRALTHCNAGGLATGGYGSAVGALFAAQCIEAHRP